MKNRKIFIFIITMLLISISSVDASSINYELKIDESRIFHETITYIIEDSTTNDHLLSVLNDTVYFDLDNTIPYQKTVVNKENTVIVSLKNDYTSNMIKKSKFLKECFKNFTYEEDNYKMIYYAESPFKCMNHADDFKITVISDLDSIINTADEVVGNSYIWTNINKDFMMDLSLGEYGPNSDVLPPVVDDEVVPSDDIDEWPIPSIESFPYIPVIITASSVIITAIVIFIVVKKNKTPKGNKEEVYYEE